MSSDEFRWICKGSDEFRFRFEWNRWIEMDSHKFRWNQIDWDGFRWNQMDSIGFKWTEIDSGEMATLGGSARMMGSRAYLAQQPWIQNLTLRLFFINQHCMRTWPLQIFPLQREHTFWESLWAWSLWGDRSCLWARAWSAGPTNL